MSPRVFSVYRDGKKNKKWKRDGENGNEIFNEMRAMEVACPLVRRWPNIMRWIRKEYESGYWVLYWILQKRKSLKMNADKRKVMVLGEKKREREREREREFQISGLEKWPQSKQFRSDDSINPESSPPRSEESAILSCWCIEWQKVTRAKD